MKSATVELSAEARRALKALTADGARIEGHRQPPIVSFQYRVWPAGFQVGTATMFVLVRRGLVAPVGEVSAERAEFRITEKGRRAL